jgi:hypothetical protein
MAGWTGLEPATFCVTGRRSNQLSYHPMIGKSDHIPEYNPIGQEGIEKVPRTKPAFGGTLLAGRPFLNRGEKTGTGLFQTAYPSANAGFNLSKSTPKSNRERYFGAFTRW